MPNAEGTASIDVLDVKGSKSGTVDLPANLFDVQTNVPLIHQVVVAQLAAARQGHPQHASAAARSPVRAASRSSRREPVAPVRARSARPR